MLRVARRWSSSIALERLFPLAPHLTSRLREQLITTATPLQSACAASIAGGCDTLIRAPTASGKTLAFLLPLLHADVSSRAAAARSAVSAIRSAMATSAAPHSVLGEGVDADALLAAAESGAAEMEASAAAKVKRAGVAGITVVLSPTRELAVQTYNVAMQLTDRGRPNKKGNSFRVVKVGTNLCLSVSVCSMRVCVLCVLCVIA
jgi:superfamily II DNA/RNA helicase